MEMLADDVFSGHQSLCSTNKRLSSAFNLEPVELNPYIYYKFKDTYLPSHL